MESSFINNYQDIHVLHKEREKGRKKYRNHLRIWGAICLSLTSTLHIHFLCVQRDVLLIFMNASLSLSLPRYLTHLLIEKSRQFPCVRFLFFRENRRRREGGRVEMKMHAINKKIREKISLYDFFFPSSCLFVCE